jgi:hypothetical protein
VAIAYAVQAAVSAPCAVGYPVQAPPLDAAWAVSYAVQAPPLLGGYAVGYAVQALSDVPWGIGYVVQGRLDVAVAIGYAINTDDDPDPPRLEFVRLLSGLRTRAQLASPITLAVRLPSPIDVQDAPE